MSTLAPGPLNRTLVNPYDPSLGYLDDPTTEGMPAVVDPWEEAADDVDLDAAARLDINALRARAAKS